jgi:hypothetical protein
MKGRMEEVEKENKEGRRRQNKLRKAVYYDV